MLRNADVVVIAYNAGRWRRETMPDDEWSNAEEWGEDAPLTAYEREAASCDYWQHRDQVRLIGALDALLIGIWEHWYGAGWYDRGTPPRFATPEAVA